jgi:glycine cleavage system P protein (glycine dehydrogenase) subunit 1
VALQCLERTHYLAGRAAAIPGVALAHADAPYFREFTLRLPGPAEDFVQAALERRILAGVPIQRFDQNRPNDLLVAVTEKRSKEELDRYLETLARWTRSRRPAKAEASACPN